MSSLRFVSALARIPKRTGMLAGVGLVLLVALVDYVTGVEVSFSIFYLIPVSFTAVASGWYACIAVCILSGISWGVADTLAGAVYSHWLIPVWNAMMRLMIFLLVGRLIRNLLTAIDAAHTAEAAAKAATHAKAEFLATMSHEIRTPLNALMGVAELLVDTPLNAQQREYVEVFRREGDHLRRLVNDILDLSKIEAGKLEIEMAPFHLGRLARSLVETFTPRAKQRHIALEHSIQAGADGYWLGDGHRLRQVLSNFLDNGIKFTKTGSVRLEITSGPSLAPTQTGGAADASTPKPDGRIPVRFTVVDTGVGMDQSQIARLFQAFSQGDLTTSRLYGGTGLGLSICRLLLDKMGTTPVVESAPGKGSRFHFTLRLEPTSGPGDHVDDHSVPQAGLDDTKVSPSNGSKRQVKVLVVEDYPANQMIFASYLEDMGCAVNIAQNGKEGVAQFSNATYDLVLMDMQMPVMDGWEATRQIRSWERQNRRKPVPIIALTASALAEDREQARTAGCSAFLAKPVRRRDLVETVSGLLPTTPRTDHPAMEPPQGPAIDPAVLALMPQYLEDVRAALATMREALSTGDFAEVAKQGHVLAGTGATFGFPLISGLGREIERLAGQRDATALEQATRKVEEHIQQIKIP